MKYLGAGLDVGTTKITSVAAGTTATDAANFSQIGGAVTVAARLYPYLKTSGSVINAALLADISAARIVAGDFIQTAVYWQGSAWGGTTYLVVAAATGTDDGGTYINAGTLQLKAVFDSDPYVTQYGARPISEGSPSVATHTAMANAIAARSGVVIDAATFSITGAVAMPSNSRLHADLGGTLSFNANTLTPITLTGTSSVFITNVTIDGVTFLNTTPTPSGAMLTGFAIKALTVKDLTVSNCQCTDTSLVTVDWWNSAAINYVGSSTPVAVAGLTAESQLSSGVHIDNNRCTSNATEFVTLADMRFIRDSFVTNNVGQNANILYWGGDSFPARGGDWAVPRWARRLTITGNAITGGNGGIWGSMGQQITISGNTVNNNSDVGIDLEGTFNSAVTGNSVSNAVNGCYSIFFYCDQITFSGNSALQDGSLGTVLFLQSNSENSASKNIDVLITGNTFQYTGATGIGTIQTQVACGLTIDGNEMRNVKIVSTNNNGGSIDVHRNFLFYTGQTVAFNAVDIQKKYASLRTGAQVTGNRIIYDGTAPATSKAIYITEDDFNASHTYPIIGNIIEGFGDTPIRVAGVSGNAPMKGTFILYDNSVKGVTTDLLVDNSNVGQGIIKRWGNFNGTTGVSLDPAQAATPLRIATLNGTNTTTLSANGITLTNVGTLTARNVANTNLLTRARRTGHVSSGTAGSLCSLRSAATTLFTGNGTLGGFTWVYRFGPADAASVSGARQFHGVWATTTAPTNVEPSTLVNCIGVGNGTANTNLFVYFGNASAGTPIDLGANFPCNTLSADLYEISLYCPPAGGCVYKVTRLNTGHVATGTIASGSIPAATTALSMLSSWRCNNATALAVAFDIVSLYVETFDA